MDSTHLHLLLNHAPVAGVAFGIFLLALSSVRRFASLRVAALMLFAVSAMLTVPVFLTGEPAEDRVEAVAGVSEATIETHEESASLALSSMIVLGLASVAALAVYARKRELTSGIVYVVGVLSIASMALIGRTAYLGGQIRHTEIAGVQPGTSGQEGAEAQTNDKEADD